MKNMSENKMQCHFCGGETEKGKNTYTVNRLLKCFERVGIEIRPEIDEHFFKIQIKI